MKNKSIIGLQVIIAAVLLLFLTAASFAQGQPYQLSGTAGYVDTTGYDTVAVPYIKGTVVSGFITNEDETNDLVVYFAKTDSSVRDVNSYVKVGPGKRLKFSFAGRKIFRKASVDSVYSQVVFGEGMDLGAGSQKASGSQTNLYGYLHKDSLNGDYSFTGSVDLTDAVVSPSLNLYGYTHKDSVKSISMNWTFDSATVTGNAIIDTVESNTILGKTGTMNIRSKTENNLILGRLDGTSSMVIGGTSSSDIINFTVANIPTMGLSTTGATFGDGTTGRPFIRQGAPSSSNTGYSFVGDLNTGLLWNSADNISLVSGGTSRVTVSNTSIGFALAIQFANMTTTARDALTPSAGWTIYNTSTNKLNFYNGSAWEVITSAP